MKTPFGMPGIGGSLGQCAICGDNFLADIILGSPVETFSVTGCNSTLHAHSQCAKPYRDGAVFDVTTLPNKSPLKQAFEANSVPAGNDNQGSDQVTPKPV